MNLLSIRNARSIWLMQIEDMNPHGLDLIPVLVAIKSRYGFQKAPKPEDLVTT